jgi:putative flippase GtrA
MSAATLALRYGLFAAIAIMVNLATQHAALTLSSRPPYGLALAMAAGTGTGLVTKYLLDKRWIFTDRSSGLAAHSRRFGLYSLTGLLTTALFWGTELAFATSFDSVAMRDVGAILGLAIGYVTKYRLDRRFVFLAAP